MRSRFTSARTLWNRRSSRRSSGWSTAAAIVLRNRAGEGDTCGRRPRLRVDGRRRINDGLYQWELILGAQRAHVNTWFPASDVASLVGIGNRAGVQPQVIAAPRSTPDGNGTRRPDRPHVRPALAGGARRGRPVGRPPTRVLEAVQRILEATMGEQLAALLRAQPYERTHLRLDVRNGVYYRRLVTELGAITDLAVPRRRLVPYRPSFLRHAARRTTTVDDVLRRAFLRGLSTRETAALATTLTGVALSPASVSRLAREIRRPGRGLPPPAGRLPGPLPVRRRPVGLGPLCHPGARTVVLAAYGIERRATRTPRLPPGGVRVGSRVAPAALLARRPGPRP